MSYFKNNGTNYTQVLAEYAANLTYDKIPAEVIERAKLMTLHTLGCPWRPRWMSWLRMR